MAKQHILVVEDDADIRELVTYNLKRDGYLVTSTPNGMEGLRLARADKPHLLVLDLMLPDINGIEVCRQMKQGAETKNIPIIMLTAKGEEADVVTGLAAGADDYVVKPFSPKVLVARIKAALRRGSTQMAGPESVLSIHSLRIHPGRHEVVIDGRPVSLTLTEFGILHLLARKPGWVFSRYQIVDEVRGSDVLVTDRSVDVQIVGLRRKLGTAGEVIETVRGVGYRMRDPQFAGSAVDDAS